MKADIAGTAVRLLVSVHGVTESDRRATGVVEKQGWRERRQGPDGRSEGGERLPRVILAPLNVYL